MENVLHTESKIADDYWKKVKPNNMRKYLRAHKTAFLFVRNCEENYIFFPNLFAITVNRNS